VIVEHIDWDCEVFRNYAASNLGCRSRVASGITWVFEHVEHAIILEEDCIPHPSFFAYCQDLLSYYRHDERIMHIGGDNFQWGRQRGPYSYYFSRYNHVWGWATWRRAWQYYDMDMKHWPRLRDTQWLLDILGDAAAAQYWRDIFDRTSAHTIDTWDYQWIFACWAQHGLAIVPNTNLISNIGFGSGATHTMARASRLTSLPTSKMTFPLSHPPCVVRDLRADQFTFGHVFAPEKPLEQSTLYQRLGRKVMAVLPHRIRKPLSSLIEAELIPFSQAFYSVRELIRIGRGECERTKVYRALNRLMPMRE
jgi:hypothetical protein